MHDPSPPTSPPPHQSPFTHRTCTAGVSFQVQPGDKIGIVGRTGSGKSSLIVTLFRLVEPFRGSIVLDGHNLLDLGLDDVRGRIAAIPQVCVRMYECACVRVRALAPASRAPSTL